MVRSEEKHQRLTKHEIPEIGQTLKMPLLLKMDQMSLEEKSRVLQMLNLSPKMVAKRLSLSQSLRECLRSPMREIDPA